MTILPDGNGSMTILPEGMGVGSGNITILLDEACEAEWLEAVLSSAAKTGAAAAFKASKITAFLNKDDLFIEPLSYCCDGRRNGNTALARRYRRLCKFCVSFTGETGNA